MIEKTPQTQRGTNIPPTGICLSPLFILAAVTDGQNVIVLMLVVTSLKFSRLILSNLFAAV